MGQLEARPIERADQSLDDVLAAIRQAGRSGVDLLVLPECAYPAYHLWSMTRYRAAGLLEHDALMRRVSAETRQAGLHVVVGLVEDTGGCLHNTAFLLGPDGSQLGAYRKQFLWDHDHDYFQPGGSIEVFETDVGRIGMLICADARAPEIVSTLAAGGTELIAMPTNWVNAASDPGTFYNPQPDFLIPARCREFGLPFVCANKSGREDDETRFCGMSRVVSADGVTRSDADPTGPAMLVTELAIGPATSPSIPSACRDRLSSARPAVSPSTVSRSIRLTVAGLSDDLAGTEMRDDAIAVVGDDADSNLFRDTRVAESWISRSFGSPWRGTVCGVSVGSVAGPDAVGFAWPRVLALDGAQLVCLFDYPGDLSMLRARAVENRVFVAAITDRWVALVGPDATVLGQGDGPVTARINISEAGRKTVARQTDIFAEHRPATYVF